MSKKNLFLISFLILFLYSDYGKADLIGSDTVVSVLSGYTFPENPLITANKIGTFGFGKNGFTLANASTSCTFDSIFPVSGTVQLNSGTLTLNKDLLFNNVTTLQGLGTIIGDGHNIVLPSGISALPSGSQVYENVSLFINSDLTITSTLTFKGLSTINGQGNTIKLGSGGVIIVASNADLTLRNIIISGITSTNIQCANDTGSLLLNNVVWDFSGNSTFAYGNIQFNSNVDFIGTSTFFYTSSQTSTIVANSQWTIKEGMALSIGRKNGTSSLQPLSFVDNTSVLKFDQSSWLITSSGMQVTKGRIVVDRSVEVDMPSTTSTFGLIVGDGTIANDCLMQMNSGASLRFGSGYFTYNCALPDRVQSTSSNAQFIRSSNSNIYVAKNVSFPSSTIILESNITPAIQVAPGYSLSYDDVQIVLPDSSFNVKCDRYNQFTFYLNGDDDHLFLTQGTMPLYVYASGSLNKITGIGHLAGTITLQDNATSLNVNVQGTFDNNILMNNGSLILDGDLLLGNNVLITGSGSINLASHTLHLPANDMILTNTLIFSGTSGTLALHGKVSWASTSTFTGNCTINGNSNILELSDTGQIVIGSNSKLILKDLFINGVSTSNIICVDDTSKLILDNVTWVQDGDYVFSQGAMQFINAVDMYGTYTFIYDSSQTSTIAQKSTWHIANGLNLFIGKKQANSAVQPLAFTDLSSTLMIDNAVFRVNANGIQLTKGTVASVKDVQIDVVSTSSINGLHLGDGTTAGDMIFELSPGSATRYTGGAVVYDVTNLKGIKSRFAETIKLSRSDTSIFWLAQSLTLEDITVEVAQYSELNIAPGKNLNYSKCIVRLPKSAFELNGSRYNMFTTLLSGSQNIFLLKGTLPLYTLVASTGNTIQGNGNVGGGVILQDSNAQLTWSVEGYLLNNLTMNNGSLTLASKLNFANGIKPIGFGKINLSNNSCNFGQSDLSFTDALYWNGSKGIININSDVTLSNTWTFSGNCILDGANHIFDLSNGAIAVERGSKLRLKNIKLQGISQKNIFCLDNAASIILDDISWLQSNNYTFTLGSLQFKNNVTIGGLGNFAYQSSQTSTILNNSTLLLDEGLTFSYDPIGTNAQNLLAFINKTSELFINRGSVYTTKGLNLTVGSLIIDGSAIFASDISNEIGDPGITIGDENEAHDVTCVIHRGSQLQLSKGSLNYKNMKSNSWKMENELSGLNILDNTELRLYQTLHLGIGYASFGNSILSRADQKEILGSINITGNLSYQSL